MPNKKRKLMSFTTNSNDPEFKEYERNIKSFAKTHKAVTQIQMNMTSYDFQNIKISNNNVKLHKVDLKPFLGKWPKNVDIKPLRDFISYMHKKKNE